MSIDRRSTEAKAKGRSGADEAKVETTATAAIVARQLTVTSVRDLAANCQVAQ